MYKFITTLALALVASLSFTGCAMMGEKQVKAVYHVNTGVDTVHPVLRNVRNHMNADPKAKIVVVTHSKGIDFLLQDAKDSKGNEFASTVSDLASKGVEFRVCNNTLVSRKIDASKLLLETKIVPSGVAEVANLQANEGYVYLKP
jgi:intracellular sulfur oxidation DsrE/DsrF family protein